MSSPLFRWSSNVAMLSCTRFAIASELSKEVFTENLDREYQYSDLACWLSPLGSTHLATATIWASSSEPFSPFSTTRSLFFAFSSTVQARRASSRCVGIMYILVVQYMSWVCGEIGLSSSKLSVVKFGLLPLEQRSGLLLLMQASKKAIISDVTWSISVVVQRRSVDTTIPSSSRGEDSISKLQIIPLCTTASSVVHSRVKSLGYVDVGMTKADFFPLVYIAL